jgi:hypothetical protein
VVESLNVCFFRNTYMSLTSIHSLPFASELAQLGLNSEPFNVSNNAYGHL